MDRHLPHALHWLLAVLLAPIVGGWVVVRADDDDVATPARPRAARGAPATSGQPSAGRGTQATPAQLPPAEADRVTRQFRELLAELDSDYFDTRQSAGARLSVLADDQRLGSVLGAEISRALADPRVSAEARWWLKQCELKVPAHPSQAKNGPDPTPAEFDALVQRLDDKSYVARQVALAELGGWLARPQLSYPLLRRIGDRLEAATDSASGELDDAWQQAWGVWLQTRYDRTALPPYGNERIERWVRDLVAADAAQGVAEQAERRLTELLSCDDQMPRVLKAIEARRTSAPAGPVRERIERLIELCKPALVAEYWSGGRHMGEQHLLVDVPSQAMAAMRPSHFDRIDEDWAHCVSGNTLQPGPYRANVAIPHPMTETAFFHLVNLPTPRRRLAYSYAVKRDEAQRLAEITRRTLDRVLSEKRPLDEPETVMLAQLDPAELSKFAGKYFLAVADRWYEGGDLRDRATGRPSLHGAICATLAARGTREAGPGLATAIEKHRFLPPTSLAPYRLHWIATLAIAEQDPWKDADAFLAKAADVPDALCEAGREDAARVGATAAAILLKRHGRSPGDFGLKPAGPDSVLRQCELSGYVYASPETAKALRRWWDERTKSQSP